jgi:acetyl-CoA acetyltransferase
VGIGESPYFKWGGSSDPEFVLCLKAIQAACLDAGLDPDELDGFVSFADDRNTPLRLANAFGIRELRWSSMQWGGGGGGSGGAIQQAVAAVSCGFADHVVVYRALAQGQFGRIGQTGGPYSPRGKPFLEPYGIVSPAEHDAIRVNRYLYETGVRPETQRAVSMASYYHAQQNPRAVRYGRPLTMELYDQARWIAEPFRLYDCCQENDGAAALIVTSAERARDLCAAPVYVVAAAQGGGHRGGGLRAGIFDGDPFATAESVLVARRLYEMAGLTPGDIDVVQAYEDFTGCVVMSLIEHGLCQAEEANEVITYENLIAPTGKIPINTSGGNLAEAYIHGLELHVEAVRQLRGRSCNQVPHANFGLVAAGPGVVPTSSIVYGRQDGAR